MKNTYLGQAWLVLGLALLFGVALAGVQIAWGPRIEQNKEDAAQLEIPKLLMQDLGMGDEQARKELELLEVNKLEFSAPDEKGKPRQYVLYAVCEKDSAELAGWVIKVKGDGYADKIELLVGLDPQVGRILGISVLDQKETPGLGNKITDKGWRGEQFGNKPAQPPLKVMKKGKATEAHHVEAISGATVSSGSVTELVNRATEALRAKLPELTQQLTTTSLATNATSTTHGE